MTIPLLMGLLMDTVGPVSLVFTVGTACFLTALVQIALQIILHQLVRKAEQHQKVLVDSPVIN